MRTRVSFLSCLAGLLIANLAGAQAPPEKTPSARQFNFDNPYRIPGRYIVRFKSDEELSTIQPNDLVGAESPNLMPSTREGRAGLADALAKQVGAKLTHTFHNSARGFAIRDVTPEALTELAKDARIDYVEAVLPARETTTQGLQGNTGLWHLDRIDQRLLPLDNTYTYDVSGSGVVVYVLDTGLWYTHEEFEGRARDVIYDCVVPPGSGVQPSCRALPQYIPSLNFDCTGHGTQVAGVIGSRTYGVAKGVALVGVIVTRDDNEGQSCLEPGTTEDSVAAFDFMEEEGQSNSDTILVNYSLTIPGVANSLEDAIRGAVNDGVVVVVGTDNLGTDECDHTPQRMPEVIAVGASTATDARTSSSGFGSCLDVFAPGSGMDTNRPRWRYQPRTWGERNLYRSTGRYRRGGTVFASASNSYGDGSTERDREWRN